MKRPVTLWGFIFYLLLPFTVLSGNGKTNNMSAPSDTLAKRPAAVNHSVNELNNSQGNGDSQLTGFTCGTSITVNHVAGTVAPVTKTVTYTTVYHIPGDTTKCWITRNLGASQQATAVTDATEASAGWYWQFNRKQGHKNDGTTVTPAWTITSINENSDWAAANDPCQSEMGSPWRIPTNTEWTNVDASTGGNWTNYNGPWNSALKMHAAGYLDKSSGAVGNRGIYGDYWSSTQSANTTGNNLDFGSSSCGTVVRDKAYGFTLRCIRSWWFLVTTTAPTSVTTSSVSTGGNVIDSDGPSVTARGICYGTSAAPDITGPHTLDGTGTGVFTTNLSGLADNTTYHIRAYATTANSTMYGAEMTFSTPEFDCGTSTITVYHTADTVAPVAKTVAYGTVTSVPGESSKCWITRNLGASQQATSLTDGTEASAGWYWQFNLKQGYMHDGTTRTPNTTWISAINQNSDWQLGNDPCRIEMGGQWRLPTYTEWHHVDSAGAWTPTGAWNSLLKLHLGGDLNFTNGTLDYRGSLARFWSSSQNSAGFSLALYFDNVGIINFSAYNKALGSTLRCLRSLSSPTVTTSSLGTPTNSSVVSGGVVTDHGGAAVSARGVCWSTSSGPTVSLTTKTVDGAGLGTFTSNVSGLAANTTYYLRAYATNSAGTAYGSEYSFTTTELLCGTTTMTTYHVADSVAPVTKTVAYATVANLPGEFTKCWITSNLGATHQAISATDATAASAGWFWQFNRTQGFSYETGSRTPNSTWINSINENSDWLPARDPCMLELGSNWRLPTSSEWTNVDNSGAWTTSTAPWNSALKIHLAGNIAYSTGTLVNAGTVGYYWSSNQYSSLTEAYSLALNSSGCSVTYYYKANGFTARCIKPGSTTVTTTAVTAITNSSAISGGNMVNDGGSAATTRGVCWSTTSGPTVALATKTSDGTGTGSFTSNISGLSPNTTYHIRAYTVNSVGTIYGSERTFTTLALTCGTSAVTVYHVADTVAPVAKTVTYGTVKNIPGDTTKCWITRNLGASQQATAAGDTTEASAGWYWQFNRKQGFKHNGNTRTPSTAWITSINENSDWLKANDPCYLELGSGWRLPTNTEWTNVDNTGSWTTQNGPWSSGLSLHLAGNLVNTNGNLANRAVSGNYWSSTGQSNTAGYALTFNNSSCAPAGNNKTYGYPVRCLNTFPVPVLTTTTPGSVTGTSAIAGGTITADDFYVAARGVCWSKNPAPTVALSSKTADGSGSGIFTSNLSGLDPETTYYLRAYATNGNGTGYGNEVSFTTPVSTCGTSTVTVYHVADSVAPVAKTVLYGTAPNIPGATYKCWITSNLGASQQATAVGDNTEPSAGWYWQFNRKQGYKSGAGTTPSWSSTTITENSDWIAANDPCNLELGNAWRIPTNTEWTNLDNTNGWASWTGPWNSGLKMHAAGFLDNSNGHVLNRGSIGTYWSNSQVATSPYTSGYYYSFTSSTAAPASDQKRYGRSVRCLRDDFPATAPNFSATPRYGSSPLQVQFTDQTVTYFPPLTWKWYFGDGDSSSVQNPVHIYHNDSTDVKAFTVTLKVTDGKNKVYTKTAVQYVKVCPQIFIAGGNVSGTWTSGNTYYIGGEIIVPYGQTLTIQPGTTVKFRTNTQDSSQMALPRTRATMDFGFMTVYGTLIAQGTQTDTIRFTRAGNTGWWGPIHMTRNANAQNPFKYCKMEYSSYLTDGSPAKDLAGLSLDSNSTAVNNCRFINNYVGIRSDSSHSVIQYNRFSSNITGILTGNHSAPVIKQNILTYNTGQGIKVTNNSVLKVFSNTLVGNGYGVYKDGTGIVIVDNSILWNNTTANLNSTTDTVKFSCVKGGYTGPGTGNITRNPKFTGVAPNPYNLVWSNFPSKSDTSKLSPCINSGNPDLNGNGIIWTSDAADQDPDMSRPDMGACYFYQNPLTTAYTLPAVPGGDTLYYDFGSFPILSVSGSHSFRVRNDVDRIVVCPIIFIDPADSQFFLVNPANSLLTLLPGTMKTDLNVKFRPTQVGQQNCRMIAGVQGFQDTIRLVGTGQGTGTVEGNVTTMAGTGVALVTITVHNTSLHTTSTGTTDPNGHYSITNVGLGNIVVKPSKTTGSINHGFKPDSTQNYIGSLGSVVNADFHDTSYFSVSGNIYYRNNNILSGCPSPNVSVLLDNVPKATTNSDGAYTIDNVLIGPHTITPSVTFGHSFTPPYISTTVNSPVAGINFGDNFKHNLHGYVYGGCGVPLANSVRVFITCVNSCLPRDTAYTNASGYFSINLPPFKYIVVPDTFTYHQNTLISFAPVQVNLESRDTVQNFIYHSAPQVEITGFGPYTDNQGWTVIQQFQPYTIGVNVYEPYYAPGGNTVKCRVESGNVIVLDDLSDGVTDTLALSDTTTLYPFHAGQPNIVGGGNHPYQKQLLVQYIRNGIQYTAEKWVYVVGQRPRKTAYATTTPEIPILILRDPPGDNSYSYFNQSSSISQAIGFSMITSESAGAYAKLSLGIDFEFSTGFIFSVSTNINTTLDFSTAFDLSMTQNSVTENQLSFIINQNVQTSSSESFIGEPGDVYMGGAMNLLYGLTDVLSITNHVVTIKPDIIIVPKGFATTYFYSEYQILNTIIPSLYLIGDSTSAHRWESFVARNQALKDQAQFKENKSFDAGVTHEYSETMVKTTTESEEFDLMIDSQVAMDAGIEINGLGFGYGVYVSASYTHGQSVVNTTENSTTTGYVLSDNDIGDDFTVDIKADKVYGTPVFVTKSGASSCPYEPGTVPRQGCTVSPSVFSQSGISPATSAVFTLSLNNTSQTNESGDYQLRVMNSSNPYGAIVMAGGQSLSSPVIYTLSANNALPVSIYISMPPAGQVYDFTGIKVILESTCDPGIGDTATFNVHFTPPCSGVLIFAPGNNWVVNKAGNNTLPVTITGYDTTNAQLQYISLEYSANGGNTWIEAYSVPRASIHSAYLTVNWDVSGFNDGSYLIRGVAKCQGGVKNYSAVLTGVIDVHPPLVVGTPQPSDAILSQGDEISFTFNEALDPNSVTISHCRLFDATSGQLISSSVQYNTGAQKIVFTISPGLSYFIENKYLKSQIAGVTDMHGNPLADTASWTFLVDQGPLHWSQNSFYFMVPPNQPKSFNFNSALTNSSSSQVYYSLQTPAAITPSFYGGYLTASGGMINVGFTTQTMTPGNPKFDTISASTLGYPDEKIFVEFYTPSYVILSVDSTVRHVPAAAGQTTVNVNSNVTWSVSEAADWLTVSPSVGMAAEPFTVTYAANTSYTARSAVITITPEGIPPNVLSPVTVTIYQAAAIAPLPVSVTITATANPVCAGIPVTFTAVPVNGGTTPQYQWKKGGTIISGATSASYTYTPANADVISCTVTSSAANTTGNPATSNTVTMTVNPSNAVSVSITASANNINSGTQVTFTATQVNGGTTPVYQWKVNSSAVSGATGSTYAYYPANNDQVQCVLTSNVSCPTGNPASSNVITMAVNSLPATLTVQNTDIGASQNQCFNATQTITVAGNSTTFIVENLGTARFIAGQAIHFLTGTKVYLGGYMSGKILPGGPWCTSSKLVEAEPGSPDSIGIVQTASFMVYPNPTNGNFIVARKGSAGAVNATIEVYSITGERVLTDQMADQKHEVIFRDMPAGLYVVRISSAGGTGLVKLIKGK